MGNQVNDTLTETAKDKMATVFPIALGYDCETIPYLSLGMVTAYLRAHADGCLLPNFDIETVRIGGAQGHSIEATFEGIASTERAICLFSSYVWNHKINLAAALEVRALNPEALIIFGGPEVPKYIEDTEQFLTDNPIIDIAVLGEGEKSCAEILERLAGTDFDMSSLAEVSGIVYRSGSDIVRTGERNRIKNIDQLPSPYLTGEFDKWFYDFEVAILETNRGCPFGCTYCDWGSATLEKVMKFDPQRVVDEIDLIAQRQSKVIFIADANFGMLEQDIEIAHALVRTKKRTGFPYLVYTNYAKNGGRRLTEVTKILYEGGLMKTGIIALQTIDPVVLKAIQRDNIKTSSYVKQMEYFNAENIPMASDIMIGLPGQTIDTLELDLQFCFDWKILANGNYTSMMPNAPMAQKEYREKFEIVADDDGLIASTSTFTKEDMAYMKRLYMTYQFHVSLGILKYYLYYLQLEHEVPALALLRRWLDAVLAKDSRLPISLRIYEEIFNMDNRSGDWALMSWGEEAAFLFQEFEKYCDEFHRFVLEEYELTVDDSVFACLRDAQATIMPNTDRAYPHDSELPHNLILYFRQLMNASNVRELKGALRPLKEFDPCTLRVNPMTNKIRSVKYVKADGHMGGWELRSPLRFQGVL
jgi:radical SAM superfamily enzyme YgiQ (UPF0313 family)